MILETQREGKGTGSRDWGGDLCLFNLLLLILLLTDRCRPVGVWGKVLFDSNGDSVLLTVSIMVEIVLLTSLKFY